MMAIQSQLKIHRLGSNVELMQQIVTTKELIAHLHLAKSLYRTRHITERQRGFLNKNSNLQ